MIEPTPARCQRDADAAVRPEVLGVREAAALLRVSEKTLRRLVGRGEVPHRRVGRQLRFRRSALLA